MRPFYRICSFLVLLLPYSTLSAQHNVDTPTIFDEYWPPMPEAPYDLMAYIKDHIRYPEGTGCVAGRVVVKCIITEKGTAANLRVAKSLHPALDSVAIDIIRNMPAWKPAIEHGRPIPTHYTIPIKFCLE